MQREEFRFGSSALLLWTCVIIGCGKRSDDASRTVHRDTTMATLDNTASFFRHRLAIDGVVEIFFSANEVAGDSVPYTLAIVHDPSKAAPALQATGQKATLILESKRRTGRLSLIPLSIRASDRSRWSIAAQPYEVALVTDSLYELCQIPCSRPDTIKLRPGSVVKRTF